MSEEVEKKTDYLEVDDPLPGQNYVCISFVSPESVMESKEAFKVSKFLQSYCKDKNLDISKVMKEYGDFTYKYSEELQKDFDERNNFQTNIRGLKVRGTYSTKEEAEKRAKSLQSIDSDFHVFVGQVGYWLPWDPCADKIEDEYYIDNQLNEMMEKYKENNINRDIFYEEEKREKIKAAREEVIRKKKEEMKNKKNEEENKENEENEENEGNEENEENEEKEEETPKEINEILENVENVTQDEIGEGNEKSIAVDEDIKNSLEKTDPWMAKKMKEKDNL